MSNKIFGTASKLALTTIIAVGSMLSVNSFAQDNEMLKKLSALVLVVNQGLFLVPRFQLMF
jgi:hypothetical protein